MIQIHVVDEMPGTQTGRLRMRRDWRSSSVHIAGKVIALALIGLAGLSGCTSRNATQQAVRETWINSNRAGVSAPNADFENARSKADPASLRVSREPWRFADVDGELISTPNYRLYTTVNSPRFLDRLPLFYERALEQYTTALANLPQPPEPLETYLFRNRAQWQLKTQELLPEQSTMFSNLGRGGFTTKGMAVLYYIDRTFENSRDTLAIAAHEGWHQYTQQTFKHQLPIWLEEGVATYMEGYSFSRENPGEIAFAPADNFERREALRDAVRDDELIPLQDLLTRSPQWFLNQSKSTLLTYYAQVWALTRFLAEGETGRYRAALALVLTDAAEGRLVGRMMASSTAANSRRRGGGVPNRIGPAVAQEYFNRDIAEFETQYLAFVQQIVRTEGGRRRRW